jgi:hypothetical protein
MEFSYPEKQVANNLAGAIASLRGKDSYAVPNRFEVIITSPSTIYSPREVSLRCESVVLPGRNLNTLTDGMPYGPTREVVDGVTYAEDITMTFVASAGLNERVFFEEWQEKAFNEKSWNVGFYDDYVKTIDIFLLNRKDERRYGLQLVEAFPKTIAGTDLSQASSNQIIKTSVTFSFRYWKNLDQVPEQGPASQSEKTFNNAAAMATSSRNLPANMPASVTRLSPGALGGRRVGHVAGAYTGPEEQYR